MGRSRLEGFKSCVRRYIIPQLGTKRFVDLKPVDVEDFYASLVGPSGLAAVTAREHVVILRGIERVARKRHALRSQPVTEALAEIKGTGRSRVKTFSPEEVSRLLAAAEHRGVGCKPRPHAMMRVMVNIAAFCGLRMGEIQGLTLDHIDLKQRVLHIRHNLTQYDELKGPKTKAGLRDVPMPAHVAEMLRDWISTYRVPNDRRLVFRTASDGYIQAQNYRMTWISLLRRAGLLHEDGPHHFHALRHFTTSWLLRNNLPLPDIADMLGHESFDVTLQVYAHPTVSPHMRHEVIERLVTQMPAVIDTRAPQTALST